MLKKFLKDVVVIVAGKPAEGLVDLLDSKDYVNEFVIAKKLDFTINQIRNFLYKLSDHGLVSFIRKKDKKKGWYTYFWKIEILKSLYFLRDNIEKRINRVDNQISNRESNEFYVCNNCRIEFNEENALLHDFTCDECGNLFTIKDNTKVLKMFGRNLINLRKEVELVDKEIREEIQKVEKKKARELKKIMKKKKEEKAVKKRIEKKVKGKVEKKVGKKGKKIIKKAVRRKKEKGKKVVKKKSKKVIEAVKRKKERGKKIIKKVVKKKIEKKVKKVSKKS
jgi:transcription factor E